MMKKSPTFWLLLGGNIIISVILPLFIFPLVDSTITGFEKILAAFVTAIFLFILEIYIYVNNTYNEKKNEQVIDELDAESSRKLFGIAQYVKQINRNSYQPYDLFRLYFDKIIGNLFDLTNSAVNKNEIKIEDNMIEITEEMYNSSFIGDEYSIFRPMYMCDDNEFFFKGFGKSYFSMAKSLVDKHKIKKVKRLFVYKAESELEDGRIKKLIHFHNNTNNYECKILSFEQYTIIKNDARLSDLTGTFAVYGSRYLYTERIIPTVTKVIGYYSKDANAIASFTTFFDRCWQQGSTHIISTSTQKKITLDNIFDEGWSL